ncbi:S8 family serine peptidase [Flavobacterium haoranii]|uniref:Serine protease, subtilisin family n=1 Tax=Flavobacterium haoranii TaxID=683124 RepID=A0A1M6E5P8_9FLAO|nr:S8 family serine peptidase [Flavobacterium haoranii]SHI80699.1 Serine protease, subtilisin family [Flavobacterium haoranii]
MYLLPSGEPIYFSIDNAQAATSTRVDFLRSGGGLGLNLTGSGMVPRMWDGGPIHNHQEYAGRITMVDGTTRNANSFHSIHVMGNIIASGTFGGRSDAKGMAPEATARSFDWNDDESEAISEAMNGMLLSNHSYGVPIANVPGAWYMGAYTQDSYNWDVIAYNFPYYLPVMSAGNDGTTTNPSPTTTGYDKLNGNKTAKNILTVANAQDATVNTTTGTITAGGTIHSSSSQGPTEDRRIKPDITGDGAGTGSGIYSCGNGSGTGGTTSQYTTMLGTSMAAPNVTGTLTLIQQHYYNVNGSFMKAATLKGLACHTATDRGKPGPDAYYGWGFLDAKSCAEAITNNGLTSWISEETLNQGQTFTMQVVAQGGGVPLLGSITWTDTPDASKINNGTLNESTPDLTNDLDIRITQASNTYYPWRLQSSATANATRNSDNNVDNVERINVDTPTAGTVYTITVTHKGTLVGGPQAFSLVVTGVTSNFTFNTTANTQTVCSNDPDPVYNFSFKKIGGASVNLSANNVPTGANLSFSQNSINSDGTFSVTLSNLTNVAAGTYEIEIIGNNGSESENRKIYLTIYHSDFTTYPQITNLPSNGSTGISTSPTLSWTGNTNAESYTLEIATDANFSNIIHTSVENGTSIQVNGLSDQTVYYWRVTPSNRCAAGNPSSPKAFQTGILNCSYSYTQGNDVVINNTVDNSGIGMGAGWSISTVNVPDNFTVGNVNMDLILNHTYIQDLTLYLEDPVGNYIILAEEACGDNDNINAKFIDGGLPITCTTSVPALTGNRQPNQPMSTFQNVNSNGNWLLYVNDPYNGDNGIIDSWTLNLCSIAPITNVPNLVNNGIVTLTNTYHQVITSEIFASTSSESASQQVFTLVELPNIGEIKLNNVILVIGDTFTQQDIDNGNLTYTNTESVGNITTMTVDVKNSGNGWIGNQVVNITIVACGEISTTWNGSSWSNGAPSKVKSATFTGNYSSSSSIEACSVSVTNNAQVTVNAGHTFVVNGAVNVAAGSLLTIENNAALRQIDDTAVNTGAILVKRSSSPMIRLDYTAWSSPVASQQLQAFSPNTVATRFYEYLYTGSTTPTAYQSVTPTNSFVAGKGYMIRVDNTWRSSTPSAYNGEFNGVPFNGIVNQSVGTGYNLLGNPYASPMNADIFLSDNTSISALYFWTNTTPASGGVYLQNNFASYTTLGGAAAFASAKVPNGTIQTGQGFYIQASAADGIVFNNAQRVDAVASTQFFRTSQANATTMAPVEKHRVWLNLNDNNTSYNQILVGYMEGATNAVDNTIDGKFLDNTKPMIYSVLNNEAYVIQGKALPFNDEDIVPLGLKVLESGNYNIAIETFDGLFDTQNVYLKDNQLNIVHDLKQSAYNFTSTAGVFENRFELVYRSTLSQDEVVGENHVSIYTNEEGIQVSSSKTIQEIVVYDVLGRVLYQNNAINKETFAVQSILKANQALIVKVKDNNGIVKTEKVIY